MSKPEFVHTYEYGAYTIGVGPNGLFYLLARSPVEARQADEADESVSPGVLGQYDTLLKAQESADRRDRMLDEIERRKVALPVLVCTNQGNRREVTFKGFNRANRDYLFTDWKQGKKYGYGSSNQERVSEIYPRSPVVLDLLIQRSQLQEALAAVEKRLDTFEVKTYVGYGNIGELTYDRLINDFTKALAAVTQAAREAEAEASDSDSGTPHRGADEEALVEPGMHWHDNADCEAAEDTVTL